LFPTKRVGDHSPACESLHRFRTFC
jgi:hypothetical protein